MSETHAKGPIAAYFVPMGINEKEGKTMKCPLEGGKDVPTHVLDVWTRAEAVSDWIGDLGVAYRGFGYTILFTIAAFATLIWVHWAVAAAFAYAAGYQWSQYLLLYAWSIPWYKGKSLMYTE